MYLKDDRKTFWFFRLYGWRDKCSILVFYVWSRKSL